jgi:hypothetical protein
MQQPDTRLVYDLEIAVNRTILGIKAPGQPPEHVVIEAPLDADTAAERKWELSMDLRKSCDGQILQVQVGLTCFTSLECRMPPMLLLLLLLVQVHMQAIAKTELARYLPPKTSA